MKKRVIAFLMITVMLIMTGPAAVFAEGEDAEPAGAAETAAAEESTEIPEDPEAADADAISDSSDAADIDAAGSAETAGDSESADAAGSAESATDVESVDAADTPAAEKADIQFSAFRETEESEAVSFSFSRLDGVSEYIIWQEGSDDPVLNITSDAEAGSPVEDSIDNKDAASYYVEYSINGETYRSEAVSVDAAELPLPAAPKKLKAYAGFKRVTLEWSKVAGAKSYVIYRKDGKGAKFKKIKTVKASKRKYVDKVKLDVKYTYKVYSKNKNGKSKKAAKVTGAAFWKIHYKISFAVGRTLTSTTGGHKRARFKAGFRTTAIDFRNGQYVFVYKGREYKISRIATYKQKVSQIAPDKTYSVREARDFVTQAKLKSRTKYLIFVNTYTQHEYVFEGKKGNWKLLWHDDIATGRASTPTQTGLTHINSKSYVENGLKWWSCCKVFSIHGLPGGAKVNYPTSGACVRNYDVHAKWVYDNCPIGTAVFVF